MSLVTSYDNTQNSYDASAPSFLYGQTTPALIYYDGTLTYDGYNAFYSVTLKFYDGGATYGRLGNSSFYSPVFVSSLSDQANENSYGTPLYDSNATYDSTTSVLVTVQLAVGERSKGAEGFTLIQGSSYDNNVTYDQPAGYDAGIGNESILLAEMARAVDVIASILKQLKLTEIGHGVDSISISSPPVTLNITIAEKNKTSTQTLSITNILGALTDALPGYDINEPRLTYDYPIYYDLVRTGTDSLAITAKTAVSDTAIGADQPEYDNPRFVYDGTNIMYSDPVLIQVLASLADADILARDIIAIQVPTTLTDTGHGVDTIVVLNNVSLTDTGYGTDVILIVNPLNLKDFGLGRDSTPLYDYPFTYDSGNQYTATVGFLNPSIQVQLPLAELGHGVDAQTITVTFSLAESGHGADTMRSALGPVLTDLGVGRDTVRIIGAFTTLARLQNKNATIFLPQKNVTVRLQNKNIIVTIQPESHS